MTTLPSHYSIVLTELEIVADVILADLNKELVQKLRAMGETEVLARSTEATRNTYNQFWSMGLDAMGRWDANTLEEELACIRSRWGSHFEKFLFTLSAALRECAATLYPGRKPAEENPASTDTLLRFLRAFYISLSESPFYRDSQSVETGWGEARREALGGVVARSFFRTIGSPGVLEAVSSAGAAAGAATGGAAGAATGGAAGGAADEATGGAAGGAAGEAAEVEDENAPKVVVLGGGNDPVAAPAPPIDPVLAAPSAPSAMVADDGSSSGGEEDLDDIEDDLAEQVGGGDEGESTDDEVDLDEEVDLD